MPQRGEGVFQAAGQEVFRVQNDVNAGLAFLWQIHFLEQERDHPQISGGVQEITDEACLGLDWRGFRLEADPADGDSERAKPDVHDGSGVVKLPLSVAQDISCPGAGRVIQNGIKGSLKRCPAFHGGSVEVKDSGGIELLEKSGHWAWSGGEVTSLGGEVLGPAGGKVGHG
jgi:hypothetical protein